MLISTPSLSHIERAEYEYVYEPAEDSFVMLDALQADLPSLLVDSSCVVVEVGSGSGIIITALAKALGPNHLYLCTDINSKAAVMSRRTARANNVQVFPIVTDLVTGLKDRLSHQVDVLVFNPPYVVTPNEEVGSSCLSSAWAGGGDGRRVMDRLFPLLPQLLSPTGKFYLLIIEENGEDGSQIEAPTPAKRRAPSAIPSTSAAEDRAISDEEDVAITPPGDIQQLMSELGFEMEVILRRRCRGEKQSVLRFTRTQQLSSTVTHLLWRNDELKDCSWEANHELKDAES